MIEGWSEDAYFILLDETESRNFTAAYGLPDALPGFHLIGMRSWDDLIVAGPDGVFTVPSVPIAAQYLTPLAQLPTGLARDERFQGRIKWHVTPLVFGGDPEADENRIWISLAEHADLVRWWNAKYRETATPKN
jgi:hypothetical protein